MIKCATPTPAEKMLARPRRRVSRYARLCRMFAGNLSLVIPGTFAYLIATTNLAFPATAGICDAAARQAATETGVPFAVLWSITRSETGRSSGGKLRPWPWTVNMEGAGHWFETRNAAKNFVLSRYNQGARSFDIGCFQINHRWHGASFRSIDHMFEPLENARYAASFLLRLYREFGNWSTAAGAYHSRTPEHANRYKARFNRIRQRHRLGGSGQLAGSEALPTTVSEPQAPRQNNYPLLVSSGSTGARGSLVSLNNDQTKAFLRLSPTLEGS
ncbi:Transglycosylase SLT domain protein [Roseovarius aestuarii]|uniref:Transglycosylase SLT domain protein n=2 Tax=Roseovarius aestuarii TaxID=475083 RepID=A0A1X7BRN4_9RHOB|nr:Transglycosylase SLT domain protein [Roseovarius aestuarii]